MKKKKITEQKAMELIAKGGVMIYQECRHDDWCKTLKTGSGFDCNCNPEVVYYHVNPKKTS